MYIGAPQNFDSSSLLMRMRLTHRVSAGIVDRRKRFVQRDSNCRMRRRIECHTLRLR